MRPAGGGAAPDLTGADAIPDEDRPASAAAEASDAGGADARGAILSPPVPRVVRGACPVAPSIAPARTVVVRFEERCVVNAVSLGRSDESMPMYRLIVTESGWS